MIGTIHHKFHPLGNGAEFADNQPVFTTFLMKQRLGIFGFGKASLGLGLLLISINSDLSVCISFALYFILQRIRRPARHIVTRIEALDGLQVIIREGKVEEVDVLYHPFLVGSLWNDDDIVLSQEL